MKELGYAERRTVELIVNVKTAAAQGITIPIAVLQRADHIIQ